MRKVFGGAHGAPATGTTTGWLREFADGIAASNLVRHGAGVPRVHGARVCGTVRGSGVAADDPAGGRLPSEGRGPGLAG